MGLLCGPLPKKNAYSISLLHSLQKRYQVCKSGATLPHITTEIVRRKHGTKECPVDHILFLFCVNWCTQKQNKIRATILKKTAGQITKSCKALFYVLSSIRRHLRIKKRLDDVDGDGDVCDNDDDMHGAVTGVNDAGPRLPPG